MLENAISRGVMSTRTTLDGQPFYQLGIAINPGNSGGPVIDLAGKVIGVATKKATQLEGRPSASRSRISARRWPRWKVEPQTAAAGATPAQRPGLSSIMAGNRTGLCLCGARAVPGGQELVTMDGSSIYKVKAADRQASRSHHRGWLITRKRTKDHASGSGT